jgi:RHS repeat-associated protein
MRISRFQLWSFAVALLLFSSTPCFAQVQVGTPPFGSFGGGPDIINLANLNSHLTVPIVEKAGRGTNFTYYLNLDSSVWYPSSSSGSLSWQPNIFPGQFGASAGYTTYRTQALTCPNPNYPPQLPKSSAGIQYSDYVYHDVYGVSHGFNAVVITGGIFCSPTGPQSALATDGSGYSIVVVGSGASVVTARTGGLFVPAIASGTGAASMTDANGNEITESSSGVITDTLGTTALTIAGSSPTTFTYTAPNGQPATYTANYTSLTVRTHFGCSGIAEFGPTAESLLTSIALPDGTDYVFAYEQTPGFSGDYTGRLASIKLPTGGTITYTYSGGSGGITCTDGSTATLTRATPDGTWTYAHTESGTAWTTTITDPQSNKTTINFQGIHETERQVYQGTTTLLETTYTCYNGDVTPANCNSFTVNLPITEQTVFPQWPGGQQARTDTFYNVYGLVTEKDEYAYGNGAPGAVARKTSTVYATLGNGIVNAPASITVKDGSGIVYAQTTYCYDEATPSGTATCSATGSPTATSGTPQHVAVTGSRGNATTIASVVQGTTTLGKTYTYYDTGNVLTATDVNGVQTVYSYGPSTCLNSFPVSVTEPLSLTRSMAWNCTGGVETSLTDENGETASAAYSTDPDFWRPNSTTDRESHVTNITYAVTGAGIRSVETSLNFNGSISTTDSLITKDSLGRVHVAQAKESQSSSIYDSQETDFNASGFPSRSTLPYAASGGTTNSTAPGVTTTYDALGRVLQTTDSGNGTIAYSYNENDVLVTSGPPPTDGESAKRRQYEYDSLGRLTSVCEITNTTGSGSCLQNTAATGFLTKYAYDLNNNLTAVTQNAQGSTTQTRAYAYDNFSRLTSEQNPESGTTLYVYDSDSTCGTFEGDLVKKTDAIGNVICYTHDALHRLTSVTYPSGSYAANTPNKYFVYDSATVNGVVMGNAKARMAEAYTAPSPTGTKITDLGFSYSVRGEVAAVYESTPHSGGYYNMNATYWPNGALDQIGGLPTLPTLTYTPDGKGRPAIVTASAYQNPVSATAYNPASLPTSMTLGSSDTDSFNFDPNTNRMTQFQFTVNSQSLTGIIGWNALGTPSSLDITDAFNSADTQNCAFAHDDLTRIATVNCGTIWGQNFTYDAFGNITKTVLSGSSGTSFQPTYATPSTNRIASLPSFTPTYDPNGNLTKDPQHQYGWDSEGRPVTIDSVSLTYDALDRMVEQNSAGIYTQIVYDPMGDKFGLMNGQTLKKAFAPLPDGGIAAYTSSGLEYYRHPDWLGSSRLASTPTRTIYSDTAYAPFGEPYAQSGTADPSFTGQNQDTTSNLYDFLFREDSSIQGRWISPDPAGLGAVNLSDPQSFNRYAYVRNSSILLIDRSGLTACVMQDGTVIQTPTIGACLEKGGSVQSNFPGLPGICNVDCGGFSPPTGGGGGGGGSGQSCVKPNFLNRLEIPVLAQLAARANETVGIGINLTAGAGSGMGVAFGGSGYLVVSPNGSAAFVFTNGSTPGVGPVSGAGFLFGPSVLQSTATSPQQLGSWSVSGGVSAATGTGAGTDASVGNGVVTTTTTVGFGLGGQGSGAVIQNSIVIPVCK